MLAAKSSLALRVDALGEDSSAELGIQHRANLEMRLKALEEGYVSGHNNIFWRNWFIWNATPKFCNESSV